MNYLDIFFVAVFVLGAIKGYVKGLIVEVFSFLAFFIGLFMAIELTIPISSLLFRDSGFFQVITVLVFMGLFLVIVVLINLTGRFIKKAVNIVFLGLVDNVLGSIAAIFKWTFILSVMIWVFGSVGFTLPKNLTEGSFCYSYVQFMGPEVFDWLSRVLPFIREMIDSLENIGDRNPSSFT